MDKEGMKECIACAELIKKNAILCKHCNTRQDNKEFLSSDSLPRESEDRSLNFAVENETGPRAGEDSASLFARSGNSGATQNSAKPWPWYFAGAAALLAWILFMSSGGGWRWRELTFACLAPSDEWAQWSCSNQSIGATWAVTFIFLSAAMLFLVVGYKKR